MKKYIKPLYEENLYTLKETIAEDSEITTSITDGVIVPEEEIPGDAW